MRQVHDEWFEKKQEEKKLQEALAASNEVKTLRVVDHTPQICNPKMHEITNIFVRTQTTEIVAGEIHYNTNISLG